MSVNGCFINCIITERYGRYMGHSDNIRDGSVVMQSMTPSAHGDGLKYL
jgi:hypothetical protein